MKKYHVNVNVTEEVLETTRHYYTVDAENKTDAVKAVRNGEVDVIDAKHVTTTVLSGVPEFDDWDIKEVTV